jgi:menaquinone-specific isochorismate synthase
LKAGVSDLDLLMALHPTPAVCGLPQEKAMHWIRETEPFSRGWYAGALGFLGADASEFFVGLRSGVLLGREFHAFAGAGIVEGSVPSLEWEEIETKFKNYTDVLHGK